MSSRSDGDRGAATVVGMALIALLVTVGIACALVGGVVLAHRRAESAADLASLAAAKAAQGQGDPCREAARISADNDAELLDCTLAGWSATVVVGVAGPDLLGLGVTMRARARAGPASALAGPVGTK